MTNITYKDFVNISNVLIILHFVCLIIICFQSILIANERILFTYINLVMMLAIMLFKSQIAGFNRLGDQTMSIRSMLYITCTFLTLSPIILTSFLFTIIS